MSIEELLDALPGCEAPAVSQLWLPEMRKKHCAIKMIFQNHEERNQQSHQELGELSTVCYMVEARERSGPN